jgi:7-keto-8-aminopelargonate synthetase-like enzyme
MDDLAAKIAEAGPRRRRLAVSDAVFSMDGDILDLPRFLEICGVNCVLSMIDEAHATGVMGATGRGLCEHFGTGHPDILMGTLSKALGSEGGYVCASRTVCDYLRNKSRAFIFSTAYNPGSAAAADAALTILEEHPELAPRVRERAQRFVAALAAQGIAARTESAIVPILVGDERRAVAMAAKLEARGFLVPAIRYPTVAKGAARLRVSVSARTAEDDLCALASAIAAASFQLRRID